jgi:hypothetical protein
MQEKYNLFHFALLSWFDTFVVVVVVVVVVVT